MNELIQIKQLEKSFSHQKILKGVSLTVKSGEVFGLLGKNGAGKSTLIDCLLGLTSIDEGECRLFKHHSQKLPKTLFAKIGVQFQASHYPDKIKVGELCQLTASYYPKPSDWQSWLQTLGLAGKEKQSVQALSGGEKQKLAILLTLIPKPEIIFLDELTTGLDTLARRQVWQLLLELKEQGLTIFLTSHYMEEVAILCDRIGILQAGQLVFYGTLSQSLKESRKQTLEDAYLWYTQEDAHENL